MGKKFLNIKIWVCDPEVEDEVEDQVYTNYQGLTLSQIKTTFGRNRVVDPVVGNFPHVAGANQLVKILKVFPTNSEDNAGLDISKVLENLSE